MPISSRTSWRSVLTWAFRLVLYAGLLLGLLGVYFLVKAAGVGSSEGAGQLAYVASGIASLGAGVLAMVIGGVGVSICRPRRPQPEATEASGERPPLSPPTP